MRCAVMVGLQQGFCNLESFKLVIKSNFVVNPSKEPTRITS